MVTCTQGALDQNYHPHLKIQGGRQTQLCSPTAWTPLASTGDGTPLVDVHTNALEQVFGTSRINTDAAVLQREWTLAARVLRAANQAESGLWYRYASDGNLRKVGSKTLTSQQLETDVFQLTSDTSGWVIPNRVHMLFDLVWQSLSSGRDVIYHLSGQDMVRYVASHRDSLDRMYDAVRRYLPELPFTLRVRIVPIAAARFAVHRSKQRLLNRVMGQLEGGYVYNGGPTGHWFATAGDLLPELVTPISSGRYLSQHDLSHPDDLIMSEWMLRTPLREVGRVYDQLVAHVQEPQPAQAVPPLRTGT
jgi:hypothetical protein